MLHDLKSIKRGHTYVIWERTQVKRKEEGLIIVITNTWVNNSSRLLFFLNVAKMDSFNSAVLAIN